MEADNSTGARWPPKGYPTFPLKASRWQFLGSQQHDFLQIIALLEIAAKAENE
jgi:hypothetical protein